MRKAKEEQTLSEAILIISDCGLPVVSVFGSDAESLLGDSSKRAGEFDGCAIIISL